MSKTNTPEPTAAEYNARRRERACAALDAYAAHVGEIREDAEDCTVRDLLCDLMHYCDATSYDFAGELKSAELNHAAEVVTPCPYCKTPTAADTIFAGHCENCHDKFTKEQQQKGGGQ